MSVSVQQEVRQMMAKEEAGIRRGGLAGCVAKSIGDEE
jgi:hypothetical protein